ncbi:hypothetical protein [Solimonas fluminis]|uniref:hypothetical protein n=1 Tax=Solimonas fluminis TaxID=2086571 RepID=UPI0013FD703B|nr:hypothetical protein [Solimonas fluminis]
MKTSMTAMLLAMALIATPAAQAAKAAPSAPKLRQAAPLRHYAYSPQQATAIVLPRPAIAGIPPAPATASGAELERIAALMQRCESAMPGAHPWRAAQAQRELFQLKVSMSYRAAADRLSPQEVASAAAIEARAYGNLAATCAPLLV